MTGDHGAEVKETLGRIGGTCHVHGEVPTRTQDADVGMMQVLEQLHIHHHICVAAEIDHLAFACYHKAAFRARIHRAILGCIRAGMRGGDHCDGDAAKLHGAALVKAHGLDAHLGLHDPHVIVDAYRGYIEFLG